MIVKCEQCQTRFKIPDDKVTEKGVKVRCTKCQHTFRVKKEGAAAADPAPAAPAVREFDPFAKFGTPPESSMSDPTRPGVFALGVEATRRSDHQAPLKPSFAAQANLPAEVFEAETRIGPMPSAPGGRPSGGAPSGARPPPGLPSQYPPAVFEAPTRAGPMPSAPPGRRPLMDPPAARPPPPPSASPFDFASLGPASSEPNPFDFGSLNPPAETTQRATMPTQRVPTAVPAQGAAAYEPQPFDFSVLDSPPPETTQRVPMPMAPAPAKPSAFQPQPFDFSAFDAPPEATERAMMALPVAAPAAKAPPSSFEPPSFDFSPAAGEMPFEFSAPDAPAAGFAPEASKAPVAAALPPPMPRPSPSAVTQNVPFPTAPTAGPPGASLLGDLPDPFAAETRPAVATVGEPSEDLNIDLDDGMAASREDRGSLFDMSDVPAPAVAGPEQPAAVASTAEAAAPASSVPLARIALKRAGQPDPVVAEAPRRGLGRRAVSVIGNGLFAVVILAVVVSVGAIFANDGKVDAASFSWTRLKSVFSHPQEMVAFDITNGLYDTRAGRPVFFVRGEVKNRGAQGSRVKVRAEILDGEDLVRAAEAWAGADPSPEDLFGIATADDLARLSERLAPGAATVAPGGQAPFLITFYEYPPELKGFRVKVTVVSQTGNQTAER